MYREERFGATHDRILLHMFNKVDKLAHHFFLEMPPTDRQDDETGHVLSTIVDPYHTFQLH
jgi:hypothetical protein